MKQPSSSPFHNMEGNVRLVAEWPRFRTMHVRLTEHVHAGVYLVCPCLCTDHFWRDEQDVLTPQDRTKGLCGLSFSNGTTSFLIKSVKILPVRENMGSGSHR